MAKKTDTAHAPPTEEVVLRDESDAIIDNLKHQLQALQNELAQQQKPGRAGSTRRTGGTSGTGGPRVRPSRGEMLEHWNASFTPYLAARLHGPAEELTQRLSRLIEQVSDPDLRAELELCRDTAFFISNTFERIRDNHQLLTESLIDEKEELSAAEFSARLEDTMRQRGAPGPALSGLGGDEPLLVSPKSVGTVLVTLAELAGTVFGTPARVAASLAAAEPGSAAGTAPKLRLVVTTPQPWQGLERHEEVSAVVFRPGVRANTVVDLLYVQKIVEMQGGTIAFQREEGLVHGFEIYWPCG